MTLQDDVSALKKGDYVRVVFKYHSDTATYEGYAEVSDERIVIGELKTLRGGGYYYLTNLTSVTVIPRPIPPEPELGSFVQLDTGTIALREIPAPALGGWTMTGEENWYSWAEIYPQIKKLWDKDGLEIQI